MNTEIIISILFVHWIADFVLQTDAEAQGKSKSWYWLLLHTSKYSAVWVFASCIMIGKTCPDLTWQDYVVYSFAFGGITFFAHTITDYFTSRLNARLWEQKKYIGFL